MTYEMRFIKSFLKRIEQIAQITYAQRENLTLNRVTTKVAHTEQLNGKITQYK